MTLADIWQVISANPGWLAIIAIILTSLIEIAPIKVNPWSKLAKGIGRAFNGEVLKELDSVKQSQADISKQLEDRVKIEDSRNADAQREYILRFNMELVRGLKHTREDFIEALAKIDEYERYCRQHAEYRNNRAVAAIENTKRVYAERLAKNDFA